LRELETRAPEPEIEFSAKLPRFADLEIELSETRRDSLLGLDALWYFAQKRKMKGLAEMPRKTFLRRSWPPLRQWL
jgi:hypothetical protein